MTTIRKDYLKTTIIFYLIWVTIFILEGFYASKLPTYNLTSKIDEQIPLLPAFVWFYVLCYILPFVPVLFINNWHRFNIALVSFAICTAVAFIGHLLIPIAFPRGQVGISFSGKLVQFIYSHDFQPGAQNFPSLHVSFSWIIFFTFRHQGLKKRYETAIFVITFLIMVSTVLVKQHLFIDFIGGTFLALLIWPSINRYYFIHVDSNTNPQAALKSITKKVLPVFLFLWGVIFVIVGYQSFTGIRVF